jgi:hypothetical protein
MIGRVVWKVMLASTGEVVGGARWGSRCTFSHEMEFRNNVIGTG